jgi:hypothetical protein
MNVIEGLSKQYNHKPRILRVMLRYSPSCLYRPCAQGKHHCDVINEMRNHRHTIVPNCRHDQLRNYYRGHNKLTYAGSYALYHPSGNRRVSGFTGCGSHGCTQEWYGRVAYRERQVARKSAAHLDHLCVPIPPTHKR